MILDRVAQYETGEHHSVAGMRIAEQLLTEIEYPVGMDDVRLCRLWVCIMGEEETDGESFYGWNTIFAGRIIFQETVFSVKHQIPVNGMTQNVIRRLCW